MCYAGILPRRVIPHTAQVRNIGRGGGIKLKGARSPTFFRLVPAGLGHRRYELLRFRPLSGQF